MPQHATDSYYGITKLGSGDKHGWTYSKVPEPTLSSMLANVANPESIAGVDCVTFQPCLTEDQANQDRYAVEDWELLNGIWKFLAIFDGHAGHKTVSYTVDTLPSLLKSALSFLVQSTPHATPSAVSDVLRTTITSFDDSLAQELLALFPGGTKAISKLTDEEIRNIINDQADGGTNYAKVSRCMQGSTALVSLIDPSRENLWVASLGDCQAVLGVNEASSNKWNLTILSANHNAQEESEVELVKQQHPGEECILRGRVLGGIAVTRAVGDHLFKLDSIWTSRIFLNADPGFQFKLARPDDMIPRILTPPYLSNEPDVRHLKLQTQYPFNSEAETQPESFLILCSDGLVDLYGARDLSILKRVSEFWMIAASKDGREPYQEAEVYKNRALRILREGLGGADVDRVAQWVTVEVMNKWLDDITIIVIPLALSGGH